MSEENGQHPPEKQRENSGAVPDNLKPYVFQPGQTGNPNGRPKGRTLLTEIRAILEDDAERRAVALAYVEQMKAGTFAHLKEVIERQDGKVPDKLEMKADVKNEGDAIRGTELVNAIVAQAVRKSGSNGHAAEVPSGVPRSSG